MSKKNHNQYHVKKMIFFTGILKENEYQLIAMFIVATQLSLLTIFFMLVRFIKICYDVVTGKQDVIDSYGFTFFFLLFFFKKNLLN